MIIEVKATVTEYMPNHCNIEYQRRDNYGTWEPNGVSGMYGTKDKVVKTKIEGMTRWGWTLYDMENDNTMTFWKEL